MAQRIAVQQWLLRMILPAALIVLPPAFAEEIPADEKLEQHLAGRFHVEVIPESANQPGALARRFLTLTRNEIAALRDDLKPWAKDPRAKLLTSGAHNEHGIRPNTQPMLAFAAVARWGESEADRSAALGDLRAMLRFVAATHSAGPLTANDGKKWEAQWQSALWAFQAGIAAWMIWDKLDADLQWLVANFIAREADRFVNQTPPARIKDDTRAEENAWNSTVIALAANMFPDHPRHKTWRETAVRWQLSSYLTADDTRSDRVVDGKPLKEWKLEPNIHPDYTLENHSRVHPSYMTTITQNLIQHLLYRWADNPAPEALDFNAKPIYAHIKFLSHTDGQLHFPNGQDWELHRPHPYIHVMMNVLFRDAEAAHLEGATLATLERMQARNPRGNSLLPTEYFFPSMPSVFAYGYATSFLFHLMCGDGAGPVSAEEFERRQAGVRHFEHGRFIAQRGPAGFVSFSWGSRVMGMAIPLVNDLMGTPYEWGFVGTVAIESADSETSTARGRANVERPVVEAIDVLPAEDHFAVAARLSRAGGAIQQQVRFISLPEGVAIYAERLAARKPLKLSQLETGTIGILNEPESAWQSGPRKIIWNDGSREVDGLKETPSFDLESRWVNIDDRWGFIAIGTDDWRYDATHEIHRGRREQRLFFAPPDRTEYDEGEVIAQRVLVVGLNQSVAETRRLARELSREGSLQTGRVTFQVRDWLVSSDFDATEPNVKVSRLKEK